MSSSFEDTIPMTLSKADSSEMTLAEEERVLPKEGSRPALPDPIHVHVIPDGGTKAWCAVAGSFLICFCTFGYINAFGVYQTYYVEVLLPSYSPSDISWIGSLQFGLLFGMGVICGKLFDAHYFHQSLLVGSVIYVGCIFALSAVSADQYYAVFLSQALGQGLAAGLLYFPAMALISHHFRKRRSLAMGITITGSSVGGIVFPIMLNNIFKSSGFAAGVRAVGYLILGCLLVANFLVSTHYDPVHKSAPKPSIGKLLTDMPYVLTLVACFFCLWGVFMIFFFIQLYATVHGISENLAFYTVTILNASSVFGRTIPNLIADKTGPFTLLVPWLAICTALICAFLGVQSSASLIVFCILYGFFSGSIFSLLAPLIATLSHDMSEYGTRLGLSFLVCGVACLTGLPISGALIGDNGSNYTWWKAVVFSAVTVGISTVLLCWAAVLQSRRKGRFWV